jgi:hypothetical protein
MRWIRSTQFCPFCPLCLLIESVTYGFSVGVRVQAPLAPASLLLLLVYKIAPRNMGFVAGESGLNADHWTAGMSFGVLGTAALCRPANLLY